MKRLFLIALLSAITGVQGIAQITAMDVKKVYRKPCTTLVGDLMLPGMPDTSGRNVLDNYKSWENGSVILVKFMNNAGSPVVRERVMRYAKEWEKYANITFKFVPDNTPITNIRIQLGSRRDNQGHNSAVGVDCEDYPQTAQTMNLDTSDFVDIDYYLNELKTGGAFLKYLRANKNDLANYNFERFLNDLIDYPAPVPRFNEPAFKGTTMHEFGHALGLLHEQSYPGVFKWKKDTVYKYYAMQNWDKARTDHNVFKVSEQFFTNGMAYDPKSIMQYPIPAWQTEDGFSVEGNNELSEGDKKIIAAMYPKNKKVSDLAVPKVIITNFVKLEVKQDELKKALVITPYFDVKTGAKLANAYYVARLTTEDGEYFIRTTSTRYNWGGFASTYLKMNLLPNVKKSYNKLPKKDLQLILPYNEIPDLAGKKFRILFAVYQDNVSTGKLDRLVSYSFSSPLSMSR